MARSPERALRREIARLALRDSDDIGAILAELDPVQRLRVQTLLRTYLNPDPVSSRSRSETPDGVSAWLMERIDGHIAAMTPAARQLLNTCANRLRNHGGPISAKGRPSLIDQGLAALARARGTR